MINWGRNENGSWKSHGKSTRFESRTRTFDIYLSGTVFSSSTSILIIQAGMSAPQILLSQENSRANIISVLALIPGTGAHIAALGTWAGALPNSVGVEREELRRRQGADLCSSVLQQGERRTKGQLPSGDVRPLIYVTLCKLQPTAFYIIPRVSAENGVSRNCIVCLEGTWDPDQVQQDLCHSS